MNKENNSLEQIVTECEGHTEGPWGFFIDDFDEEHIIDVPFERDGPQDQPWGFVPIAQRVVERADAMLISHAPTLLRLAQEATERAEKAEAALRTIIEADTDFTNAVMDGEPAMIVAEAKWRSVMDMAHLFLADDQKEVCDSCENSNKDEKGSD